MSNPTGLFVLARKRGNSWYLHWNDGVKRHRRSIGNITPEQAEQQRLKLAAALLSNRAVEITHAPRKRPVRSANYAEIQGCLSVLMHETKKRAARLDRRWTITRADMERLLDESAGFCALSGLPFDLAPCETRRRPFAPSLDRMDGGDGYTPENCRLVCVFVNNAIADWGLDVLQQVALGMNNFTPAFRVIR